MLIEERKTQETQMQTLDKMEMRGVKVVEFASKRLRRVAVLFDASETLYEDPHTGHHWVLVYSQSAKSRHQEPRLKRMNDELCAVM